MKSQDNLDKYLIHNNKQILQTLKLLAKNKCLITARFHAGKYSFVTVVIDILLEQNLVILDYGTNDTINKKILTAPRVIFAAVYNGIRTQFSTEQITQAKFKGNTVFAVPIPDSVLWMERREFYRVKIPLTEPVYCKIPLGGDKAVQLYVSDMSITGLALIDPKGASALPEDKDSVLTGCALLLPEHEAVIDLTIKNHTTQPTTDNLPDNQRIGCAFVNPTQAFQSKVLQFMQYVERQKKHVNS